MTSQKVSPEFMAQRVLHHTEQDAIYWFINNEAGDYFAYIDGWSVGFKGDGNYGRLTFQKGPQFDEIVSQRQGEETPTKTILRSLLIQIRKRVYPEGKDIVSVLEEQKQKIRKEFCASLAGLE